tara:strand:+ start:18146 stop:19018 length:873 start_codon:yes stop_codon:yes gene_type:complete
MPSKLTGGPILATLLIISLFGTACERAADDRVPAEQALEATETDSAAATSGAAGAPVLNRPVDSETLPYADVNEALVYGHFAFPSDMIEPLPAIILIHDWWGLNDDIRAVADRLASEGFMVLAIDLYSGETVTTAQEARQKTIQVLENQDDVAENMRQAITFVEAVEAPAIGTVGWGFGGGWSLEGALLFPAEIEAAVIYYGQVSSDEERLQVLEAPVLGLFGRNDRRIEVESVRDFEEAMQRLRKPVDIQVYADAGHSFADPAHRNFDAAVAEDAWTRMLDFFALNLVN